MTREQAIAIRNALNSFIDKIVDNPVEINENTIIICPWKEGLYITDNVRMYNDIPYRCIQTHDSTGNPSWNPADASSLWTQYHGTTKETARPWVEPTGAHDIYKVGEYMIWTDGKIYQCTQNTNFNPEVYPMGWKIEE